MLPARFAPFLFAAILSGLMSFLVSGLLTLRATGLTPDLLGLWITNWAAAWALAFPAALLAAPPTRRIVARLTKAP